MFGTTSPRPSLRTRTARLAAAVAISLGGAVAIVSSVPSASAAPLTVTSQWVSAPTHAIDPTCTFTGSWTGPQLSLAPAPGNQVWVTIDQCDDGNSRAMLLDGTDGSVVSGWETTPKFEQAGSGAAVDGSGLLTRPFDAVNDGDPLATTTQTRIAAGNWSAGSDCPAGTTPASLFDGGSDLGIYCIAQADGDPDLVRTVGLSNADVSLGVVTDLGGRLPTGLRSDANPTALGVSYPDITTIQQWDGSAWTSTNLSQAIPQIPAYPAGSDDAGRAIVFGTTVNSGGYAVHEVNTDGQVNSGTVPAHATFFANAAVDASGKLYVAEFDAAGTQFTIDKYDLAAAPPSGDTVSFTITGNITYSNSQTVTTGGVAITRDGNGVRTVASNATFPSAVSGNAQVFTNISRFWILPVYIGTVKLYDAAASIGLNHVVLFSKVNSVGLTGATNTQMWADFSHLPWRSYTMTWTFHDLAP